LFFEPPPTDLDTFMDDLAVDEEPAQPDPAVNPFMVPAQPAPAANPFMAPAQPAPAANPFMAPAQPAPAATPVVAPRPTLAAVEDQEDDEWDAPVPKRPTAFSSGPPATPAAFSAAENPFMQPSAPAVAVAPSPVVEEDTGRKGKKHKSKKAGRFSSFLEALGAKKAETPTESSSRGFMPAPSAPPPPSIPFAPSPTAAPAAPPVLFTAPALDDQGSKKKHKSKKKGKTTECSHCGSQIPKGYKFCNKCGARV
jgi:hypothetical protein